MDDWRNFTPGRTGVTVAQIGDNDSVEAQIVDEPYRDETSQSDDALHVPVVFLSVPDGFEDMSGEAVETAEDSDDPQEYNIINSSSAFTRALLEAFPNPDATLNGQSVEITATQEGEESYSRTYTIEAQ